MWGIQKSRNSLFEILGTFNAGLRHQIANVLFEIVYSVAHVIDACDDLLGHRLEFVLYVLQQILNLCWLRIRGGLLRGLHGSLYGFVNNTHVKRQLLHILWVRRVAVDGVLLRIAVHVRL